MLERETRFELATSCLEDIRHLETPCLRPAAVRESTCALFGFPSFPSQGVVGRG